MSDPTYALNYWWQEAARLRAMTETLRRERDADRALLREIAGLFRHTHYTLLTPELLARVDKALEEDQP